MRVAAQCSTGLLSQLKAFADAGMRWHLNLGEILREVVQAEKVLC